VLLWLFAAPTAALLVVWLVGSVSPPTALAAALASQAAAHPCWSRLERRRMLAALRRRHEPGVSVLRVRLSRGDLVAQLALRTLSAVLLATVFLVIVE
jgi:hypothetical protein